MMLYRDLVGILCLTCYSLLTAVETDLEIANTHAIVALVLHRMCVFQTEDHYIYQITTYEQCSCLLPEIVVSNAHWCR